MDLVLQGFRSHSDSRFRIKPDCITLLQGPSGVGKSTILKAIHWVLYGSLKKVYDNSKKMKKCSVTLSIDSIFSVYRQKNPELLKVTVNGKTYEDKVAQSIIVKQFGSENYWLSSTYLTSNEPCLLLSASQKEKMRILNEIALTDEDPDVYLEKIQQHIDSMQKLFNQNKDLYDSGISDLKTYMEENPSDKTLAKESIEEAEADIQKARDDYAIINAKLFEIQKIKSKHEYINDLRSKNQSELHDLGDMQDDTELQQTKEQLESNMEDMRVYEQYTPDIKRLQISIEELDLADEDRKMIVTDEYILKIKEQTGKYTISRKFCNKYNIPYNVDSLQNRKEELTKLIQQEPLRKLRQQVKRKLHTINEQLVVLDLSDEDKQLTFTYDNLIQLKEQTYKYNKSKEVCKKYKIKYDTNDLNERKNKLRSEIRNEPYRRRIKQITLEMQKIIENHGEMTQNNDFTRDDIDKTREEWRIYNFNKVIFDKYNLVYNKDELINRMNHLNSLIEQQPVIKDTKEWHILNERVSKLNSNEITNESLTSKYTSFKDAKNRKDRKMDILSCPACTEELVMHEGALHVYSELAPPTSSEVKALKAEYEQTLKMFNEYQEYVDIKEKMNILQKDDNLKDNEYIEDLTSIKRELNELQKVTDFINKPKHTVAYIENVIDYSRLFKEKSELLGDSGFSDHNSEEEYDVKKMQRELEDLSTVEVVSKPLYKVDYIERIIKHQKLLDEKNGLLETSSFTEEDSDGEEYDIKTLQRELEELSNAEIVDEPQDTVDKLLSIKKYNHLSQELHYLKEKLANVKNHNITLKDLKTQYEMIISQIKEIDKNNTRRKELHDMIKSHNSELKNLVWDDEIFSQHEELQEDIENAIISLDHTKKVLYIKEKREDLLVLQNELKRMHEKLTHLKYLRELCIKIECETLQSTVDSINETMNQITDMMFDDPISVKMQLFKPIKSKDLTKANVNITISLKGGDYDSIWELSSGERNRVNLAVTIALARISPVPFVLFDECVSSLDADLRERSIKAMRDMLTNKTVIDIEHFVVEGLFDNIITLVS